MRTNDNIPLRLADETTAQKQEIINRLKDVYTDKVDGTTDFWLVARDWLQKMKNGGYLDPEIIIPD